MTFKFCNIKLTLFKDQVNPHLEVSTFLQPLRPGVEIIIRLDSDLKSNGFYTDSNGIFYQQRFVNRDIKQIGASYYPVVSHLSIQDKNRLLTLMPDRSQGGSSLNNGSMELMIHRRTLDDDAKGMNEKLEDMQLLNGTKVPIHVNLKHFVVLGNDFDEVKEVQNTLEHPLHLLFSTNNLLDIDQNYIKAKGNNFYHYFKIIIRKHKETFIIRIRNTTLQPQKLDIDLLLKELSFDCKYVEELVLSELRVKSITFNNKWSPQQIRAFRCLSTL